MKTVLVAPPLLFSDYPPMALMTLYAALEEAGLPSTILDLNYLTLIGELKPDQDLVQNCVTKILNEDPGIIAITSCVGNYSITIDIARRCKENNNSLITILGGPQATITANETLHAFPFIDIIVLGEGEITFPELIKAIRHNGILDKVSGIAYLDNNNIIKTPNRSLVSNMDQLPMINYTKIQKAHPYLDFNQYKRMCVEIGRGCSFSCSFCCVNRFWNNNYRIKSSKRCIEELSHLQKHFPNHNVELLHDSPTISKKAIEELCLGLKKGNNELKWAISSRIELLDDELMQKLKDSGCIGIFIGIESASSRIQKFYNKKVPLAKAHKIISSMLHVGIEPSLSFIIGHPEETPKEMLSTLMEIIHLSSLGVKDFRLEILAPHSGTPIADEYPEREWFYPTTIAYEIPETKYLSRQYPEVFSQSYIYKQKGDSHWILKYLAGYQIFLNTFAMFPDTITLLTKLDYKNFENLLQEYCLNLQEYINFFEQKKMRYGEAQFLLNAIHYNVFPNYLEEKIALVADGKKRLLSVFERESDYYTKLFGRINIK